MNSMNAHKIATSHILPPYATVSVNLYAWNLLKKLFSIATDTARMDVEPVFFYQYPTTVGVFQSTRNQHP